MKDIFKLYHTQSNSHISQKDHKNDKTLPNNTITFSRFEFEIIDLVRKDSNYLIYMFDSFENYIDSLNFFFFFVAFKKI